MIIFVFIDELSVKKRQNRFTTWIQTREGWTHWILKYESESKLYKLWIHFVNNDGFVLPFFCRKKGSNYWTTQRILNLIWLISSICAISSYVAIRYKSIESSPSYLIVSIQGIFVLFICSILSNMFYIIHKYWFERIRPQKLEKDLSLMLRNNIFCQYI